MLSYFVKSRTQLRFQHHSHHRVAAPNLGTNNHRA
ncbi:MAG: acyloxyacyl hydrolase [Bacteroidales bacterium]|nr:acyloxyacyl hydrolase [Bacteroidales bacterium]